MNDRELFNHCLSWGWQGEKDAPQLSDSDFAQYREEYPQIDAYIRHWQSEEFNASVLDGLIALAQLSDSGKSVDAECLTYIAQNAQDIYRSIAYKLICQIFERHYADTFGLHLDMKCDPNLTPNACTDYSKHASKVGFPEQTKAEFLNRVSPVTDLKDVVVLVWIKHQPPENRRYDFGPKIICLHEVRHMYQNYALKLPYTGPEDMTPSEIDARFYQEAVFTFFDPEKRLDYDNRGFHTLSKLLDSTQNGISCLGSDEIDAFNTMSASFSVMANENKWYSSLCRYIYRQMCSLLRIYHANREVVFYDKSLDPSTQCPVAIELAKQDKKVVADSMLNKLSDLVTMADDLTQPRISAARHEYIAYIHKRLAAMDAPREQWHYAQAMQAALHAVCLNPQARLAKYVADNILRLALITGREDISRIGESIFCDSYVFTHLHRMNWWVHYMLPKRAPQYVTQAGNITAQKAGSFLQKIPEYNADKNASIKMAEEIENTVSCTEYREYYLRDFYAGATLLYQMDRARKKNNQVFTGYLDKYGFKSSACAFALCSVIRQYVEEDKGQLLSFLFWGGSYLLSAETVTHLENQVYSVQDLLDRSVLDTSVQWSLPLYDSVTAAYHANLAGPLFKQGKQAEAILHAKKAQQLGCTEHPVYAELAADLLHSGLIQAQQKAFSKAKQILDEAVHFADRNDLILPYIGCAFLQFDMFADAEKCFSSAIRLAPTDSVSYAFLSGVQAEQGRLDEALHSAKKARQLKYTQDDGRGLYDDGRRLNAVGNKYHGNGIFADAVKCYQAAIELKSDVGNYHANLAGSLMDQGKEVEALPHAKKARQLGCTEHWVYTSLAVYLLKTGTAQVQQQATAAKKTLTDALTFAGQNDVTLNNIGVQFFNSNQFAEAEKCYLAAIASNPSHGIYYAHLSEVQAEQGRSDKALHSAKKSKQLSYTGNDGSNLNRTGNKYHGKGLFADATGCYRAAIELKSNNGTYHANLAGSLVKQRKQNEAVPHAKKAQQLGCTEHWVFGELRWRLLIYSFTGR